MDKETVQIVTVQQHIKSTVRGEGWQFIRKIFIDRITDLQNAFNIEDDDAMKMLTDLRARKIASEILFEVLRTVEAEASVADENVDLVDNSHIVRL